MEDDELKKLIELAKRPAKKKDTKYLDEVGNKEHIRLFIQETGLKPGKIKMMKKDLYRFYLSWVKEAALGYREWSEAFEHYFKKVQKHNQAYFYMRRYYGERIKKQKEAKQTAEKQVSGFGEKTE